jgi:hypothetical protein
LSLKLTVKLSTLSLKKWLFLQNVEYFPNPLTKYFEILYICSWDLDQIVYWIWRNAIFSLWSYQFLNPCLFVAHVIKTSFLDFIVFIVINISFFSGKLFCHLRKFDQKQITTEFWIKNWTCRSIFIVKSFLLNSN